jgi:hypothetical protein
MPEHVHLLLSEPKKGNLRKCVASAQAQVSGVFRQRPIKSPAAQLPLHFRSMPDARAFWRRLFYDFNVWSVAIVISVSNP